MNFVTDTKISEMQPTDRTKQRIAHSAGIEFKNNRERERARLVHHINNNNYIVHAYKVHLRIIIERQQNAKCMQRRKLQHQQNDGR